MVALSVLVVGVVAVVVAVAMKVSQGSTGKQTSRGLWSGRAIDKMITANIHRWVGGRKKPEPAIRFGD